MPSRGRAANASIQRRWRLVDLAAERPELCSSAVLLLHAAVPPLGASSLSREPRASNFFCKKLESGVLCLFLFENFRGVPRWVLLESPASFTEAQGFPPFFFPRSLPLGTLDFEGRAGVRVRFFEIKPRGFPRFFPIQRLPFSLGPANSQVLRRPNTSGVLNGGRVFH